MELKDMSRAILDAMPIPILVVDAQVHILDMNPAARVAFGSGDGPLLHPLGGEALHCVNSYTKGCGNGEHCQECVIRRAVGDSVQKHSTTRRPMRLLRREENGVREFEMLVTCVPLESTGEAHSLLVLEDVTELHLLKSLIPICMVCRKVRNDQQYWESLENYFRITAGIEFSHGLCPDCRDEFYAAGAGKSNTGGPETK